MNKTVFKFFSIFVMVLFLFTAIEATAQSLFDGGKSFVFSAMLNEAAGLDQCANGGIGNPVDPCSGAAWVNGNVNNSKAHWFEGQSVAYRQVLTGFTVGSSHTVTIGYDTTKGGKHALDYLTSFDRTETLGMGNNPCSGVAGCSLGTFTTFPIPVDPNVTAGFDQIPANGDDITQIPGVFTLFGGTITGVSAYTLSGTYAGDSHTSIVITFTANSANMALSWGGHIGARSDWGALNSAVFISGSPYHVSQDNCSFGCGSQDRALSANAIVPTANVVIIKDAQPNSLFPFSLTSTGQVVSAFSLVDNGVVGPDRTSFNNLSLFGAGNAITVTEFNYPYWIIPAGGITCVETGGTVNSTVNISTRTATIIVESGELVTCTFVNQLVSAAAVSVNGRVLTADGYGIGKVSVAATSIQSGQTYRAVTNPFGYYQFEGLVVGDYVIQVSSKRYVFTPDTRFIMLENDLSDFDFVASP